MTGAFLQGLLCLLPYRNIALVAPVMLYLLIGIVRTALQATGALRNPYMDGVVTQRTSPIFPDENGNQDKPASQQLCTIQLAVRSNSPLGMLAPGFKEVGDYFTAMTKQLDKNAAESGYLGSSAWISAADRTTGSEFMSLVYFDSVESLHRFSHGALHTEAMEWWHRTAKKHEHIGIMHEVYNSPANNWEAVYLNYHPTGLGATRKQVTVDGEKVWMNPLVEAKGQLRYSKGRMNRGFSEKQEWPEFENAWSRYE